MLYKFMLKDRARASFVGPIETHASSPEMAREITYETLEAKEADAQAIYELVPIDKVPRRWMGTKPTHCDLCRQPLGNSGWVDGRTSRGIWGNMCVPKCFRMYGVGLGQGFGQQYDGNGWKVGG